MKNRNSKSLLFLAGFGLAFFSFACNNNGESTKSSATDSENTSINHDTAANKMRRADTNTAAGVSTETAIKKQSTTRRKGKATIGIMSEKKTNSMKPDRNGVYEMTEVHPAYPGGQSALEDYVTNNIEYPQMAIDDNKEGTVLVQFVIDENGKVEDANVVGSKLGDGLDEEAARVISKMPKWEPGKVKGKNVKTRLVMAVTYKIEE